MAFTLPFDPTKPLGTEDARTADDYIRNDKAALAERLALEHYFTVPSAAGDSTSSTAAGRHRPGATSVVYFGTSSPVTLTAGALWYNTTTLALHICNGTDWNTKVSSPSAVVTAVHYAAGAATSYDNSGAIHYSEISTTGIVRVSDSVYKVTTPGVYMLTMSIYGKYPLDSYSNGTLVTDNGKFSTYVGFYQKATTTSSGDPFYTLLYVSQNVQSDLASPGNGARYLYGSGSAAFVFNLAANNAIAFGCLTKQGTGTYTGTTGFNCTGYSSQNFFRLALVRPL